MTDEVEKPEEPSQESAKTYSRPTLTRWGTIRELTHGGGGIKTDPVGVGHPRSRS